MSQKAADLIEHFIEHPESFFWIATMLFQIRIQQYSNICLFLLRGSSRGDTGQRAGLCSVLASALVPVTYSIAHTR